MGLGKRPVIYRLLSLRDKVLRQHSQIPWVRLEAELEIINELILSQVNQHSTSLKGKGRAEQGEYRRELDWVLQWRSKSGGDVSWHKNHGVETHWVLAFHLVDPRGQTQVPRLGCRYVYSLSHLIEPIPRLSHCLLLLTTGTLTGPSGVLYIDIQTRELFRNSVDSWYIYDITVINPGDTSVEN